MLELRSAVRTYGSAAWCYARQPLFTLGNSGYRKAVRQGCACGSASAENRARFSADGEKRALPQAKPCRTALRYLLLPTVKSPHEWVVSLATPDSYRATLSATPSIAVFTRSSTRGVLGDSHVQYERSEGKLEGQGCWVVLPLSLSPSLPLSLSPSLPPSLSPSPPLFPPLSLPLSLSILELRFGGKG